MRTARQENGSRPAEAITLGEWGAAQRGEPRLEELMEDPMMGLLWRRDGLEPTRVRETIRELRAIVRAGREAFAEAG